MIRQCMAQRYGHLKSAIVLILLTPLLMPFSSAQIGIASVSLDCGDDPIMNVNPAEYQDVDLICTITNDGQFLAEEIKILDEWDGNPTVAMMLSEDTFTLDTGEEEDFTVTFIGDSKIDASFESEFVLEASVTSWGGIPVEGTFFAGNSTHTGDFTIAKYGLVTLDIPDTSSRNMMTSDEVSIVFQLENDGNAEDRIKVEVTNSNELEMLGFVFTAGTFFAQDVQSGGISTQLELIVRAPSDAAEEIRSEINIVATSSNDDSAIDSVSFDLIVAAEDESSALGGLSLENTDDLAMYGAIGGGVLFIIFLLIIISRISKRNASRNVAVDDEPKEEAIEIDDEFDLDLDFDDDDDFESDDLDSMFDDL
tara:strand:+ start:382 stop:1479 length:1098 start_codon:yes stop_codon:yes gene_type:complete